MKPTRTSNLLKLLPVFFGFAVMGFIDITGVVTSYVKQDFGLTDKVANLLPGMTLIWFLVISLPTAALMNRIGRKNTVLLSLGIMLVALLLPLAGYTYPIILTAFALLGVGNTILQVSLNPLLKNIVSDQQMTSSLTFGQFVKAIVSLLGPILIGFCAMRFGSWTVLLNAYAAAMLIAAVWLLATPIAREEAVCGPRRSVFALLKDPYLTVCFLIIVLIVGFEICIMTAIPKLLLENYDMPLEKGGLGCSLFYACKTAAAFAGAFILSRVAPVRYLIVSLVILLGAMVVFGIGGQVWIVLTALAVLGLASANVFSVVLSIAIGHRPEATNEISALIITGVAGGALLPPLMGVVADMTGQQMSLLVPFAAVIIMLLLTARYLKPLKTNN